MSKSERSPVNTETPSIFVTDDSEVSFNRGVPAEFDDYETPRCLQTSPGAEFKSFLGYSYTYVCMKMGIINSFGLCSR